VDDSEGDSYKQKIDKASELYLQVMINSDLLLFPAMEEHIFQTLKEVRKNL